ncbi:MAG: 30S ribosomal protein S15 [Legionellales bacterium]|nr:30S ribosomal protein S15 [Legionellales bacterium]|tara:strand:- start:847 stop:1116 length:270 start_codon:yes stop_codon:yes gene_type:complete
MTLSVEAKAQIVGKYRQSDGDTGSPQVQVALLTARIDYLTQHMKANKKDKHSRRGLMALVSRRRRLLDYLKGKNAEAYLGLIQDLGLRR